VKSWVDLYTEPRTQVSGFLTRDVGQACSMRPIFNRPGRHSGMAHKADCKSAAACKPAPQATWSSVGILLALAVACAGCGYHVSGKGDTLPKTLRTIAIPAFRNLTVRYKLNDHLPEAIAQEFIARSRYTVVPDEKDADMVLHGAVLNFVSYPIIFDQATGRATALQVNVTLSVTLTERESGKVLYSRPTFEMHQRYEISIDPNKYFEESDTALERLSHDTARQVVSAILENF